MLIDGLEWCGLLWCFYQLFGLSFWRHPFTAEHPLLRHWCRDTFQQTWWRNKLILILDGLRVRIVMQIMSQRAKNNIYCLKTRACFLSFNFEANDLDVSLTALARLCIWQMLLSKSSFIAFHVSLAHALPSNRRLSCYHHKTVIIIVFLMQIISRTVFVVSKAVVSFEMIFEGISAVKL